MFMYTPNTKFKNEIFCFDTKYMSNKVSHFAHTNVCGSDIFHHIYYENEKQFMRETNIKQPNKLVNIHKGVPLCMLFSKSPLPKNMSFQYIKNLVSPICRVFLHHFLFSPHAPKIQRIFKIYRGKCSRRAFQSFHFKPIS